MSNQNSKFVIVFSENEWMDELATYSTYEEAMDEVRNYFFENSCVFGDEDNVEEYFNNSGIKIFEIKV